MYVLHVPILWWYGRYYVHSKIAAGAAMAAAIYPDDCDPRRRGW